MQVWGELCFWLIAFCSKKLMNFDLLHWISDQFLTLYLLAGIHEMKFVLEKENLMLVYFFGLCLCEEEKEENSF